MCLYKVYTQLIYKDIKYFTIMPESPEVSYQASYIAEHFNDCMLKSIEISRGRYKTHGPPENYNEFIESLPLKLLNVEKKGKVIFLKFSEDWYIISKLGLTGHWYKPGDEPTWIKPTPNVSFIFNNKKTLIYTDQLSYGTLTFVNDREIIDKEFAQLAPDITDIRLPILLDRLKAKPKYATKLMEDILIDQKALFSGVGNYLTAEILYESEIAPKRTVDSLSDEDWNKILISARKIIKRMSSVINDLEKYTSATLVYQKSFDPLGNKVYTHTSKTGRTIHWVQIFNHNYYKISQPFHNCIHFYYNIPIYNHTHILIQYLYDIYKPYNNIFLPYNNFYIHNNIHTYIP